MDFWSPASPGLLFPLAQADWWFSNTSWSAPTTVAETPYVCFIPHLSEAAILTAHCHSHIQKRLLCSTLPTPYLLNENRAWGYAFCKILRGYLCAMALKLFQLRPCWWFSQSGWKNKADVYERGLWGTGLGCSRHYVHLHSLESYLRDGTNLGLRV